MLLQELFVLVDQVSVAALGFFRHEVVIGLLQLLALAPLAYLPSTLQVKKRLELRSFGFSRTRLKGKNPCLGDLVHHGLLAPAKSGHRGLDAVPVLRFFHRAHADLQWPQLAHHLLGQLSQRDRNVLWLRHPLLGLALLASFAANRGLRHPARVDGLQVAELQGMALLTNAERTKLAPMLHKRRSLRHSGGRQSGVILGDVLCLWLGKVVVREELLHHSVAICLAALFVRRDLLAAENLEGSFAASQGTSPLLGHLLRLVHRRAFAWALGLSTLGQQSLRVQGLTPLVRHSQQG